MNTSDETPEYLPADVSYFPFPDTDLTNGANPNDPSTWEIVEPIPGLKEHKIKTAHALAALVETGEVDLVTALRAAVLHGATFVQGHYAANGAE